MTPAEPRVPQAFFIPIRVPEIPTVTLRKTLATVMAFSLALAAGCGGGNKVELPTGSSPPPKLQGGPAAKPGSGNGAGQLNLPPPPPPPPVK